MTSDAIQIGIAVVLLVVVMVLVRRLVVWRFKRAVNFIMRDLESKGAFDPAHAVDLPYAKRDPWRLGVRNYYAPAVEEMIRGGIVGQTEDGMYFLIVRPSGVV